MTTTSDFTVLPPPTITSFTPTSGLVETSVTISGTNFTGATAVTFNFTQATFTVIGDTQIQATVPAGGTTGPVAVTAPGGTATSAANFTVEQPPTIENFQPDRGHAGTLVAITGKGFVGTTAVTFNGTAATFVRVVSDTRIEATVPSGVKAGPIRVTAPGGTATSANSFLVTATITGFSPTSGPVGTAVTINGVDFTGTTRVTFNGTAATFTVTSDSVIQTAVPAGATTGLLTVTTPVATTASGPAFTVAPIVTSFAPASGRAGTTITITGLNFLGTTAVRFNGTPASFSGVSETSIQATVPAGATSGPISVTAPAGTGTSTTAFIVRVTLTVAKTGVFRGTVTSTPAGIACGSTCAADFNSGTVVTLTPTPAFLSLFSGWSGCDSVSGTTCRVTMNANKSVTANFIP